MSRAMISDFRTLAPLDPLARAVELILNGSQQDSPVLEEGRVAGILMRGDLLAALAQRGQEVPVAEVMQREFQEVDAAEMMETAFARLHACQCHTIPVTRGGRLVGLVTMENVGEFLMIHLALGPAKGGGWNAKRALV